MRRSLWGRRTALNRSQSWCATTPSSITPAAWTIPRTALEACPNCARTRCLPQRSRCRHPSLTRAPRASSTSHHAAGILRRRTASDQSQVAGTGVHQESGNESPSAPRPPVTIEAVGTHGLR